MAYNEKLHKTSFRVFPWLSSLGIGAALTNFASMIAYRDHVNTVHGSEAVVDVGGDPDTILEDIGVVSLGAFLVIMPLLLITFAIARSQHKQYMEGGSRGE